jgi:hypothetical protein
LIPDAGACVGGVEVDTGLGGLGEVGIGRSKQRVWNFNDKRFIKIAGSCVIRPWIR